MRNIVLSGMRASGKTRIGLEIAKFLKCDFVDLDDYIVTQAKMTIPEIVKNSGWPAFRQLEKEACEVVSEKQGIVISTGGGTVLYQQNVDCLKKNGMIVFLAVEPKELRLRLKHSKNRPPLYKNGKSFLDELEDVWRERKKCYFETADLVCDANKNTGHKKKDIAEKAKQIINLLKER